MATTLGTREFVVKIESGHLISFLSIIIAVSATWLLLFFGSLVANRSEYRFSLPFVLCVTVAGLFHVQYRTGIVLRPQRPLSMQEFVIALAYPCLLVVATATIIPKESGDRSRRTDLQQQYEKQAPLFYSLLIALMCTALVETYFVFGEPWFGLSNAIRVGGIALGVSLIIVRRNKLLSSILLCFGTTLIITYMLMIR